VPTCKQSENLVPCWQKNFDNASHEFSLLTHSVVKPFEQLLLLDLLESLTLVELKLLKAFIAVSLSLVFVGQ
jgi:hypothetical protein